MNYQCSNCQKKLGTGNDYQLNAYEKDGKIFCWECLTKDACCEQCQKPMKKEKYFYHRIVSFENEIKVISFLCWEHLRAYYEKEKEIRAKKMETAWSKAQAWWDKLTEEEKQSKLKELEEELKNKGATSRTTTISWGNIKNSYTWEFKDGRFTCHPDTKLVPPPFVDKFTTEVNIEFPLIPKILLDSQNNSQPRQKGDQPELNNNQKTKNDWLEKDEPIKKDSPKSDPRESNLGVPNGKEEWVQEESKPETNKKNNQEEKKEDLTNANTQLYKRERERNNNDVNSISYHFMRNIFCYI